MRRAPRNQRHGQAPRRIGRRTQVADHDPGEHRANAPQAQQHTGQLPVPHPVERGRDRHLDGADRQPAERKHRHQHPHARGPQRTDQSRLPLGMRPPRPRQRMHREREIPHEQEARAGDAHWLARRAGQEPCGGWD